MTKPDSPSERQQCYKCLDVLPVDPAVRLKVAVADAARGVRGGLTGRGEPRLKKAGHVGEWTDRKHFFHVAAMAIRQVLIDHARRGDAQRRGGQRERLTFADGLTDGPAELDLVDFNDALTVLESRDPRQARVVELRFIVGMTIEETADVLGVSPRGR